MIAQRREGTMHPITKPRTYYGRGCWRVIYNPNLCSEALYKAAMKHAAKLNRQTRKERGGNIKSHGDTLRGNRKIPLDTHSALCHNLYSLAKPCECFIKPSHNPVQCSFS
jgi:hypothetical protein